MDAVSAQFTVVANTSHSFETEEEALEWAKERANRHRGLRFVVVAAVSAVDVSQFGVTRIYRGDAEPEVIQPETPPETPPGGDVA